MEEMFFFPHLMPSISLYIQYVLKICEKWENIFDVHVT